MKPRSLLIAAGLATLLIGGGYALARQGMQTCGWLDRLTGSSGCLGSVRFEGVLPAGRNASLPYGDEGLHLIGGDLRTADGWRTGLIVLDPVSGEEAGRYQLPLTHGEVQLFAEPDASRILVTCGLTVGRCGEDGGVAVTFRLGAPQEFTPFPLADSLIRAWPGLPVPDEEAFGFRSLFVAGGARILADGRNEGLQLFDAEGKLIADLAEFQLPLARISLSPDGMRIASWAERGDRNSGDRIMVWNALDGQLLAEVKGTPGWHLRAPPFLSVDGRTVYAPRFAGSTMILDRFGLP